MGDECSDGGAALKTGGSSVVRVGPHPPPREAAASHPAPSSAVARQRGAQAADSMPPTAL